MNRLRSSWLVVCAGLLVASLLRPVPSNGAQDSTKATVSALQTQAADLKTMVALQTEVAGLQAQLTPSSEAAGTLQAGQNVLYQADWSNGMDGWSGSGGWKTVGGMLVNDGTNDDPSLWIPAPYEPGSITDYAIEAEIQLVSEA